MQLTLIDPYNLISFLLFKNTGGLFQSGFSYLYRGKYFMEEDIVLVTLNYRVSSFGKTSNIVFARKEPMNPERIQTKTRSCLVFYISVSFLKNIIMYYCDVKEFRNIVIVCLLLSYIYIFGDFIQVF
jgi:hypothetical protein